MPELCADILIIECFLISLAVLRERVSFYYRSQVERQASTYYLLLSVKQTGILN